MDSGRPAGIGGLGRITLLLIGDTCYVLATDSDVPYVKAKKITLSTSGTQGAADVTDITVTPNKTAYKVNEAFNTSDIAVTASYADFTSKTLSSGTYTIEGFNTSSAGTKTVTVKYGSYTDTYLITVSPISVKGIA